MPGATRNVVINAPVSKVWAVLTDYEKYPQFIDEAKSVVTSNRNGNQLDATYTVQIIKTFSYTIHVTEEPQRKITWTYVKGDFMKENRGAWTLEEQAGGQTKVTYEVKIAVGALVPKSILNVLVDTNLPKLMDSLKRRVEST